MPITVPNRIEMKEARKAIVELMEISTLFLSRPAEVFHFCDFANLQLPALGFIADAAVRGRTILNSVNSPGVVSTSIDAAVLLHDDVVTHRKAESGAFARRLGGEERIEHLVPDLGRNAGAVVADPDLDAVAEVLASRQQASAR